MFLQDTDSAIVVHNKNHNILREDTGGFLGEMSDELQQDHGFGSYGDKFYASSSKSYGLRIRDKSGSTKKWHSRTKGITKTCNN